VSKIRNYSGYSDKINRKAPKYSHYGPVEKTRMKYFENHMFTMCEGSLENLYQQIGSYQLFGKISVQEHCMQVFVQKNRELPAIGLLK
jgi:hypothetical protein